ncbi:MAG TPA: HAMP domain-containing sensor histidine kinase [Candidatus Polarisedimenticolia bacterium]|nr:HAMP domain-containing sensor histidine kinase [Candidatus Polarisedimenticolia bacterium]
MIRGSIVARVTRGTVVASLITALTLAAAAAAITFWLWRAREQRMLAQTVMALSEAVDREARDEASTRAQAAPEALRESGVTGYRIEVWQGARLLAANMPGPPVGPYLPAGPRAGWLAADKVLEGDLHLLVAAPARGGEAVRVFGWSLLLATPLCFGVALLIGRFVGRRTTRPLVEFRRRIAGARPLEPLPDAEIPGAPSEVRELDEAFHALWRGLREALAREVEFAANASHELRTPLTRMRLHAERAMTDAGPIARAELGELTAEVDRMVRLVESLLVLARDVSAGMPHTEVVNLADTVRAISGRTLKPGRADLDGLPDEALIRGDEELLGIAVENLFENAAKFGLVERPVGIHLDEQRGRIRLIITSPGARITEAERDLLFERFYRSPEARAARRGHGLGLPLARHIARLHGGDVSCISRPDEDACFVLEIPTFAVGKERLPL